MSSDAELRRDVADQSLRVARRLDEMAAEVAQLRADLVGSDERADHLDSDLAAVRKRVDQLEGRP